MAAWRYGMPPTVPVDVLLCRSLMSAALLALSLTLMSCSSEPVARRPDTPGTGPKPPSMPTAQLLRRPGGYYNDDAPDVAPPVALEKVPDAQPRPEALNASANEPYSVFGRDYVPLLAADGYKRQGTASWYGRKFHGQRTSSGEIYDMYAMTAAHPTLPIPSYARVTNLENNRSVIVRINDRGPYGSGRVMDVSYAAAWKLGFTETAIAPVEVEGITTGPAPAAPRIAARDEAPAVISAATDRRGIFLQLGAFGSRNNAENFRSRVKREFAQVDGLKGEIDIALRANLYRVQIGPYATRALANAESEKIREAVEIKPVLVVR